MTPPPASTTATKSDKNLAIVAESILLVRDKLGNGDGSFGQVHMIQYSHMDHEPLVLTVRKLPKKNFSETELGNLQKEVDYLHSCDHKNLNMVLGCILNKDSVDKTGKPLGVCIVSEYCEIGKVHDVVMELNFSERMQVLEGTARALSYLHAKRPKAVIHGNLKTSNIFLTKVDDSTILTKVADFGLNAIKSMCNIDTHVDNMQDIAFLAPEIYSGQKLVDKRPCDVYSFGCVMYEMLTNRSPWQGMKPAQIKRTIQSRKQLLIPNPLPLHCPSGLIALMRSCLSYDPKKRPTFEAIVKHLNLMVPIAHIETVQLKSKEAEAVMQLMFPNEPSRQGDFTKEKFEIQKIERIRNDFVEKKYREELERVKKQNRGNAAERVLFYGPGLMDPDEIVQKPIIAIRHKNMFYGEGVYFSELVKYTHFAEQAFERSDGSLSVIICSVICGNTKDFLMGYNRDGDYRQLKAGVEHSIVGGPHPPKPNDSKNASRILVTHKEERVVAKYIVTYGERSLENLLQSALSPTNPRAISMNIDRITERVKSGIIKRGFIRDAGMDTKLVSIFRSFDTPAEIVCTSLRLLFAQASSDEGIRKEISGLEVFLAAVESIHHNKELEHVMGLGIELMCLILDDPTGLLDFVPNHSNAIAFAAIRNTSFGVLTVGHGMNLLRLLARNDKNQILLIAQGAGSDVPSAIKRFKSNDEIASWGCATLSNLALNDDNRVVLMKNHAYEAILIAMKTHPKSAEVQFVGCCGIINFAMNSEFESLLIEKGAHDVVIAAMKNHTDDVEVQRCGCGVISNLSESMKSKATLMKQNPNPCELILVAMAKYLRNAHLQLSAICALVNLSAAKESKSILMKLQVSEAVILSMKAHSSDPNIQSKGCSLFRNLASSDEYRTHLAKIGAISVVFDAMKNHGTNAEVSGNGCAALWNIGAMNPDNRVLLMKQDAGEVIMSVMKRHGANFEVQTNGCGALMTLCAKNADHQAKLLKQGAGEAIIRSMAGTLQNAQCQYLGICALVNLFANKENISSLVKLGAFNSILAAMKSHPNDSKIQSNGCEIMTSQITNKECKEEMEKLKVSVILKIAKEQHSENSEVLAMADRVLQSLDNYGDRKSMKQMI